jgi:hypothetical protein
MTTNPAPGVEQLIKSRHRVKVHGEVFTPRTLVNQMLDLVREELETGPGFVDKTFFEPAAGDGNFLVAILHRKLRAVTKRYQQAVWPSESLFALASIYGVELLEDNHEAAKAALLAEFVNFHARAGIRCGSRTNLRQAAVYLLDQNIVRGNTLTGLNWRGEEIEFSWWNRVLNVPSTVQREPFTFASLREAAMFDFAVHDSYAVCRIDRVHKEEKANA